MVKVDVYLNNEDMQILNELCANKPSKSGCIKEIIRNYYQMQKEEKRQMEIEKIEKKIDEILMILKSQQHNTRQTNTIDMFMKKGK